MVSSEPPYYSYDLLQDRSAWKALVHDKFTQSSLSSIWSRSSTSLSGMKRPCRLLKASRFSLIVQSSSEWVKKEARGHCYMEVWPMERANSVSHHLLIPLIPNTHKLPLFISHAHKMLFLVLILKNTCSLLEVPKLVTLGCSAELTWAWQQISH